MKKSPGFWIGLSLINLSVVALFGLLMRSKMIFSMPFLDYRNLMSAHSHYAFGGWVGLALITFLIYKVLPGQLALTKIYQYVLWGIQVSSAGMGLSFPVVGYHAVSISFSTLYILVSFVFGWFFFKDVKKACLAPVVRWLSIGAVASLLLSSIGPFGISYILFTKNGNSLLYRDSIYTFLHLQYNGFFTLSVFAVFFIQWMKKGLALPPATNRFAVCLLLSVLPSLFLALLWHDLLLFYILAAIGCLFTLSSVFFFIPVYRKSLQQPFFKYPLTRIIWLAASVSFITKMILTIGTLYPPLGQAVYGARPVIIGFLHLVFLAFVSFSILVFCLEQDYFIRQGKPVAIPFYIFGAGVFANEALLMAQGMGVLLKTNSAFYNQALWVAAILLFVGSTTLAAVFYRTQNSQKKAATHAATLPL